MFVYFERQTVCHCAWRGAGGAERGRAGESQAGSALSAELDTGLES